MCWGRGEGEGAWEPEGVCDSSLYEASVPGCLRSESLFVSLITTETKKIPG